MTLKRQSPLGVKERVRHAKTRPLLEVVTATHNAPVAVNQMPAGPAVMPEGERDPFALALLRRVIAGVRKKANKAHVLHVVADHSEEIANARAENVANARAESDVPSFPPIGTAQAHLALRHPLVGETTDRGLAPLMERDAHVAQAAAVSVRSTQPVGNALSHHVAQVLAVVQIAIGLLAIVPSMRHRGAALTVSVDQLFVKRAARVVPPLAGADTNLHEQHGVARPIAVAMSVLQRVNDPCETLVRKDRKKAEAKHDAAVSLQVQEVLEHECRMLDAQAQEHRVNVDRVVHHRKDVEVAISLLVDPLSAQNAPVNGVESPEKVRPLSVGVTRTGARMAIEKMGETVFHRRRKRVGCALMSDRNAKAQA